MYKGVYDDPSRDATMWSLDENMWLSTCPRCAYVELVRASGPVVQPVRMNDKHRAANREGFDSIRKVALLHYFFFLNWFLISKIKNTYASDFSCDVKRVAVFNYVFVALDSSNENEPYNAFLVKMVVCGATYTLIENKLVFFLFSMSCSAHEAYLVRQ